MIVNHRARKLLQCIVLFGASITYFACNSHAEDSPPSRFDRTRPVAAEKKAEPVDPMKAAQELKAREAARARGEVTFDDLKFDIEKDGEFKEGMITDSINKMEGETIRLRGFILPSFLFQQKGFNRFVLVRDNQECCFGPGAALYDCVMVEMEPGKTADFTTRVVTVKGNFATDTKSYRYPDGEPYAVFKIIASEVK
ncbi:MAG: DUF3299 domain-containing protein [Planctomycetota bacterium]|nr:DUF3299 domain-containing protein [Planctomycetota bacterium]